MNRLIQNLCFLILMLLCQSYIFAQGFKKQNKEQILAEVNKTSDLNIKIGTNSEKIQKMKISPIPCEIAEKMQKLKLDFMKT